MILGIGCDIIEIERVRKLHSRFGERMQRRMFTENEIFQAQLKKDPILRFAKYIAAKEAVYKALPSQAQSGFSWRDAEVLYGENGKPELHLKQGVVDFYSLHLSLSDSDSSAMAYVVIEAPRV